MDQSAVDLSIVVCSWNNAERLGITLDAIAACDVPDALAWECVVVNNNSTDDTEAVAQSFKDRLPLVYVFEPKQGLSNARNAGLAAAKGRYVLFADDDVRPYPEWIASYWRVIQERPDGWYYGGPVESEFGGERPPDELLRHTPMSIRGLDYGADAHELTGKGYFLAANWCAARADIEAAGGFNPELGLGGSGKAGVGEESALMEALRAAGIRAWYEPAARLRHFVPAGKVTLAHIVKRKESGAYYREMRDHGGTQPSGRAIGGVPVDLVRRAVKRWFEYRLQKIRGEAYYHKYFEYRQARAQIRARRDIAAQMR